MEMFIEPSVTVQSPRVGSATPPQQGRAHAAGVLWNGLPSLQYKFGRMVSLGTC